MKDDLSEILNSDKGKTVYLSNAQHIGSREEQQDYFAYSDVYNDEESDRLGLVAVLADGMGGHEGGRQASRTAVNTFLEAYKYYFAGNVEKAVLSAVNAANKAVNSIENSGSTIVAAVVKDFKLHWITVGDSRMYLFRNGALKRINKDHNYGTMLRSGRMAPMDENLADSVLVSYLGVDEVPIYDISNRDGIELREGDMVLLCSDGLYNAVAEPEIVKILQTSRSCPSEALVSKALEKKLENQDNVTVMVLRVE